MNYLGTIGYRAAYMGHVHEGFMASFVSAWTRLQEEKPGRYHFARGLSALPNQSANQLYNAMQGDFLLMLDVDHVFDSNAFIDMIETYTEYTCDVLVGFTQKRQPPYHPVLYKTDFKIETIPETIFPDKHEFAPIPIDSSGAACLMVRRTVFESIQNPRYKYAEHKPFDVIRPDLGEDSSFFKRVRKGGFQAWCAPWIKFHHLETRLVTDDMIIFPDKIPSKIPTEFLP